MASILLSRTVLQPLAFEWWQAGEIAPIDCTGFSCAVAETTLPWTPAVITVNAALGRFALAAPTGPQAASLPTGRRYSVHVVLFSGAGVALEEFKLTLVAD